MRGEPGASTSDHGWDLQHRAAEPRPIIRELRQWGCRVSLFLDPDPRQMALAAGLGADRVELYTAPYAVAFAEGRMMDALPAYAEAAQAAAECGLGVNAGHDLNRHNLPPLLETCAQILEVSIGHALIADALELGLASTVRQYLQIVAPATKCA